MDDTSYAADASIVGVLAQAGFGTLISALEASGLVTTLQQMDPLSKFDIFLSIYTLILS